MESSESFRPAPPLATPINSALPTQMEWDQGALFQRVVCPVEASLNGLLWNRSISPNSLLETTISEEVRPGDLEEDEAALQATPSLLPSNASRRHTLAEVSARFHHCTPPCIVISPSDGASSDSCLKSSSNPTHTLPAVAVGDLSALVASGLGGATLEPIRTPLALSSNRLLQNKGCLHAANFQEGRRASDTSLTQGLKAFRQQLRKNSRTKGFLGLNKIKGLARQVCPPTSCSRGSRGSLGPTLCPTSPHRSMLEEVLHQQRMLQIQHQPQVQPQLQQVQPQLYPLPSPPLNSLFAPATLFSNPPIQTSAQPLLPGCHQNPVALQHTMWQQQQPLDSSPTSSYTSLSQVASTAHLLEARLHISQQPHLHTATHLHNFAQLAGLPQEAGWGLGTGGSLETLDIQEQLSSCVMVK